MIVVIIIVIIIVIITITIIIMIIIYQNQPLRMLGYEFVTVGRLEQDRYLRVEVYSYSNGGTFTVRYN